MIIICMLIHYSYLILTESNSNHGKARHTVHIIVNKFKNINARKNRLIYF